MSSPSDKYRMHLRQLSILLEKDKAFARGKQVDWAQFKASLAASGHKFGTNDRFDAIVWLGLAGDPSGKMQGDYAKPARLYHERPLYGIVDAAGFFNPMTGAVSINPDDYPTWDGSMSAVLAHELRHRGFHISSKINAIRSKFPDDVRDDIANFGMDGNKWNAEHKMLYAIGYGYAYTGFKSREEAQYWQQRYLICNTVVREWLRTFPMPKDAPAALQAELEKMYGTPVELVAPGEAPKTTAKPVVVAPDVARDAPPPKDAQDRRNLLIQQALGILTGVKDDLTKIAGQEDAPIMKMMLQKRQFVKLRRYLETKHGLAQGDELYDALSRLRKIQLEIKKLNSN